MLTLKWNGSLGLVEEFRKLIEKGGIDLRADDKKKQRKEMSFNGEKLSVFIYRASEFIRFVSGVGCAASLPEGRKFSTRLVLGEKGGK